ncbi:MAG: hypothetical protein AB1668_07490 [Nanoarchaeota archaeon]
MKTLEKILSIVSLAGALAACGADNGKESCTKDTDCREPRVCDSDLGYCVDANGSSGSSSGNYSNPCGNSPVYEKHLWTFTCNGAMYMGGNCIVSATLGELDKATYSGLNIMVGSKTVQLDPNFRFKDIPGQVPYWKVMNERLDKYGGYVLLNDRCKYDGIIDCGVYTPLDEPYDPEACRNSEFYINKGDEY